MEVLLNGVWDYRKGFYIDERHAPVRYRARRFLEKRAFPAFRKAGLAIGAAAVAAIFTCLALLEQVGEVADDVLCRLEFLPYRAMVQRIIWETTWWARGWKALAAFGIFTIPALAAFWLAIGVTFLLVGFFALAGKAASKVKGSKEICKICRNF